MVIVDGAFIMQIGEGHHECVCDEFFVFLFPTITPGFSKQQLAAHGTYGCDRRIYTSKHWKCSSSAIAISTMHGVLVMEMKVRVCPMP